MLPSTSLLLVICAFSTTLAIPNYSCKIYLATTPISTQNVHLSITPPANQSAMTAFITSYTSQTSKYFMTSDTNLNGGPHSIDVNDRYQIYTQLCTPSTFENGTDVEFVVHGCVTHGGLKNKQNTNKTLSRVGFDHTYWNFGGNGSENNYVESVIAAGRSVLIYDALGRFNSFITKSILSPIYFSPPLFLHRCWPIVDARWYHNSTEICRYRDRSGALTRIKD